MLSCPFFFMSTSLRRSSAPLSTAVRWSPEQAADYAARRDFRLLQHLSTDRRAFAVARRLGVPGLGLNGQRRDRQVNTHGARLPGNALRQRAAQMQTVTTMPSDAGGGPSYVCACNLVPEPHPPL